MSRHLLIPLAGVIAALSGAIAAQGKNLLFYGNSFSSRNGTVANIVQVVATEAGHATPTIVKRFAGGQDLHYHATNAGQVAAIHNALPSGHTWDCVVMQGQSTEATQTLGDPSQFRTNAVNITANVRNHSPMSKVVLYQTWARAIGHHYYPNTFATAMAMHSEIRDSYANAAADINSTFGADTAQNSAVGDGVSLLEWAPSYYEPDMYHPLPRMTLLAGMCLYSSIYNERCCDIDPDFNQATPLVNWLTLLGLSATDWYALAPIADRVARPDLRPFPGSGDHLLLESSTLPAPLSACGEVTIGFGSLLAIRISSKNQVFDGLPAVLLGNAFAAGTPPPASAIWPELQIDTGSMFVLSTTPQLSSQHIWTAQLPFTVVGAAVLVQGLAWGPSAETGNAYFATTDAHVLTFQ